MVITEAGIATPLGSGWGLNAQGFPLGRRAIQPVTRFDVSKLRAKVELPHARLSERTLPSLNRADQHLVVAMGEALAQSGWILNRDVPQVLATACCGMECGEMFSVSVARNNRGCGVFSRAGPFLLARAIPAAHVFRQKI